MRNNWLLPDCPYLRARGKEEEGNAIYQFKEFMPSAHVATCISPCVCPCRLCGIDVRPRFLRAPFVRENSRHDLHFTQRRNAPDSSLRRIQTVHQRTVCGLLDASRIYAQLANGLLPSLSNGNSLPKKCTLAYTPQMTRKSM